MKALSAFYHLLKCVPFCESTAMLMTVTMIVVSKVISQHACPEKGNAAFPNRIVWPRTDRAQGQQDHERRAEQKQNLKETKNAQVVD